MIFFPRIGRQYWYLTNLYEEIIAVPVTVVERGGMFEYCNKTPALWRVVWQIVPPDTEYHKQGYEEHLDASRWELYASIGKARRAANKANKKLKEARQRENY